jgi:hypothetical protein
MKRKTSRREAARIPLTEVLAAANSDLKPHELFEQSGFTEEFVDEFYVELRRHVVAGEIRERRDSDGESMLVLVKALS